MYAITTPAGETTEIPETREEDSDYFTLQDIAAAREWYEAEGFVVIRGLIDPAMCLRLRAAFDHIRHTRVPILRQKNMRYERNEFTADGMLSNPIFNVQDLRNGSFRQFRTAALDILTSDAAARVSAGLLGADRTKLIQSMFFEAPAGTWAHQDSYYQDSATGLGGCVAGWFALEDIDAGAGRFWVSPRSHRSMPVIRNEGENSFAEHHQDYKQTVLEVTRERKLPCVMPFLAMGDVLFWNSLTVHGSLPASRPGVSRLSLTAHYLREGDEMLQFHQRIRTQAMDTHNGMKIGLLHDQRRIRNKLMREVGYHLPGPYMAARRLALRVVVR